MHSHILIPIALDHENISDKKIDVARRLLSEGGRITLLTVLEEVPEFVTEFVDMKPAEQVSQGVRARLGETAGRSDDISTAVVTGKAGMRIAEYARDNAVDLIVVGSHCSSMQDYFLGSTASRVARRAPCSVYILR